MDRQGSLAREGKIDLDQLLHELYNRRLIDIPDRFSDRIWDALASLCERGFVWFKHMGNPQQIVGGEPRFLAQYELTPKGRKATEEDVKSGWPLGRGLLDRFPKHLEWDETMGAFFRMAFLTYESGRRCWRRSATLDTTCRRCSPQPMRRVLDLGCDALPCAAQRT